MVFELTGMKERFERAGIGLKDTLAVIDMMMEDQGVYGSSDDRTLHEAFRGLNELTDRTVRGTKIERFRPMGKGRSFHSFEVHTEEGDVLGYLNMIYLRKPIPCYYLVYVEIVAPFRGRGLGNKILKDFREFVDHKGAVGLLDNIIPPEEVTYGIYTKLGWQGIGEWIGNGLSNGEGNYMVYVPPSIRTNDLRKKLVKLLFNLRKKRPVIDMHENEAMVKRTIEEFRTVYKALERLFEREISFETSTPFIRFLFTKFITKLLGFRRRISELIGYTGGESLEQISISDRVRALPIQPFSLWGPREVQVEEWGEKGFIDGLPDELKRDPTAFIENLPLYRRPYLLSWLDRGEVTPPSDLRISDLLDLGFDPTRLREFHHEGVAYIFERISPSFLPSVERVARLLPQVAERAKGIRIRNAAVRTNPSLALFKNKGNAYVLRRKVEGIHAEEALDQLRASPSLKEMNRTAGIDRALKATLNEVLRWVRSGPRSIRSEEIGDLAFFVPWDIERNLPLVSVTPSGVSIDTVWIA